MDARPKTRQLNRERKSPPPQAPRGAKQIVIPMTRPQYDDLWHQTDRLRAFLAEWAEAGWLQPIDGFKELMQYNADAMPFATESMTYKGRQYGLTYYAGFMGFLYNDEILRKAGYDEAAIRQLRASGAVA